MDLVDHAGVPIVDGLPPLLSWRACSRFGGLPGTSPRPAANYRRPRRPTDRLRRGQAARVGSDFDGAGAPWTSVDGLTWQCFTRFGGPDGHHIFDVANRCAGRRRRLRTSCPGAPAGGRKVLRGGGAWLSPRVDAPLGEARCHELTPKCPRFVTLLGWCCQASQVLGPDEPSARLRLRSGNAPTAASVGVGHEVLPAADATGPAEGHRPASPGPGNGAFRTLATQVRRAGLRTRREHGRLVITKHGPGGGRAQRGGSGVA